MWKASANAAHLLKLGKALSALGRPISSVSSRCQAIVMEMNHVIDVFNISKKGDSSFLRLDHAFDRKLLSIAAIRTELDMMEAKGDAIEDQILQVDIPFAQPDALALRHDVVDAVQTLRVTVGDFRSKLDDVETQLDEIRQECRAEVSDQNQ